jgi:phenylalanyl-tRNA synthetase beta chain
MLVSLNWLQDFIKMPVGVSPQQLGELLTLHTVEVEGVKKLGENLDNIVVGKILKLEQHPNADRLKLATVDVGKEKLKVVCGGSNLRVGMLVALAKIGAQVRWHGQGDLVTMEAAVIRGEKSEGMICTAAEIGLADMFPTEDEREVMDLNGDYRIGSDLAQALGLGDVIYDIDNKSMTHRPDLWSHYGMARDIAAVLNLKLKKCDANLQINANPPAHNTSHSDAGGRIANKKITVKVEDEKLCPRYMAVVIDGIKIEPSPDWMQKRLVACGLRPINNVVDISNYVMLELGQPTHAFDRSRIFTEKVTNSHQLNIVVRRAKKNETIKTLDGVERKLDEDMLVIANEDMPLAVAGVMGGENSGVDESTTSIVIESANFAPVSIRQTAQKLGLRTDASARFEKSLDPNLCEAALARIVNLIQEFIPGAKVASPTADIKKFKLNQGPIKFDLAWLNKKIGVDIKPGEVKKILTGLGFDVSGGKLLNVKVPTWRATKDISIPEDLVEEIARVHGYNAIQPAMPAVAMQRPDVNYEREFRGQVKDALVRAGMTETYNYSFINEADLEKLGKTSELNVRLANPLTSEHTLLRNILLPGLLRNVVANQRQHEATALFEIGNVFVNRGGSINKDAAGREKLSEQKFHVGAVYAEKNDNTFYRLKGFVEYLFKTLHIRGVFFRPTDKVSFARPGRAAEITDGSRIFGYIFEPDGDIARRCGVKTNVSALELEIDALFAAYAEAGAVAYRAKNKFPVLMRDMAFVVDKKILYNNIREEILSVSKLIREVEVFDVYAGKELGAAQKNVAVHISFGSDEKTLTGEEVDSVQKEIAAALQKKLNAQLRDF